MFECSPSPLGLKDILGPAISLLGAGASAWYFYLSRQMSNRLADRSIYVDGQKFLIEICKQLMDDPALWCLYDEVPMPDTTTPNFNAAAFQGKIRAFAHLHLNMFEIIVNEVPAPGTGKKKNASNVWFDYLDDTLSRSKIIRDILEEEGSQRIWSAALREEYRQWKLRETQRQKDITAQQPLSDNAS